MNKIIIQLLNRKEAGRDGGEEVRTTPSQQQRVTGTPQSASFAENNSRKCK